MSYRGYLKNNEHWQKLRREALEESKRASPTGNMFGRCMKCGYEPYKPILQLHHKTYENRGHETLDDVILLCPRCHAEAHGKEFGKLANNTKDADKTAI